jgi:dihydroorotate dehydrogenase
MSLLKTASGIGLTRSVIRKKFVIEDQRLKTTVFGLSFPNPVGLAAGFDKDAKHFNELADLGFGFIETGTVTPLPQDGNPKPRLFRLPVDGALINRMGFNNEGVDKAAERLKHRNTNIIIGGNIGKNKITPNEEAIKDYLVCFEKLYDVVDYFVVNVSSPNTPDLRELQDKKPLQALLAKLMEVRNSYVKAGKKKKPLLLKIAPDLNTLQLDDIISIVKETGIDGLVATNTTISREGLMTGEGEVKAIGNGGLSGRPLRQRATEVIRYLSEKSGGSVPIIAAGGIHSAEDALEKLRAGASLVQIYTGFIYEGPSLIRKINEALLVENKGNK